MPMRSFIRSIAAALRWTCRTRCRSGRRCFAVQSTHKMLAAFSMASMIHIKNSDRAPLEYDQFNESFMMHGTTSPFYPMIASLDVAAAMMDEPAGPTLMSDTIDDAINFRKAMSSIAHRLRQAEDGWFFKIYQPEQVDRSRRWRSVHIRGGAGCELLSSSPRSAGRSSRARSGMALKRTTCATATACSTRPR